MCENILLQKNIKYCLIPMNQNGSSVVLLPATSSHFTDSIIDDIFQMWSLWMESVV